MKKKLEALEILESDLPKDMFTPLKRKYSEEGITEVTRDSKHFAMIKLFDDNLKNQEKGDKFLGTKITDSRLKNGNLEYFAVSKKNLNNGEWSCLECFKNRFGAGRVHFYESIIQWKMGITLYEAKKDEICKSYQGLDCCIICYNRVFQGD